jgi:acetoin:2,6-dichlorophenolindophenol oxidoreductase subunit alpha
VADDSTLERLYVVMVRCRSFEEAFVKQALLDGVRIGHPYAGQEAVAAGVFCALAPSDRALRTHRSHGHAVAAGCDLTRLALELFGKAGGLCRGRAGEMGVAQMDIGFMGATEIVAGNLPMGVGLALAAKLDGSGRCVVAFVGDGGVNQGSFHESLNLAAIWSLPYVIVVENNHYAESTPVEYATAGPGIAARASAYGIPGKSVDGQSAPEVLAAVAAALERARAGAGPSLVEARTYRYYGHYYGDRHERYRTPVEVAYWKARDPITLHRQALLAAGVLTEERLEAIELEARSEAESAVAVATAGAEPSWDDLTDGVFAPSPVIG